MLELDATAATPPVEEVAAEAVLLVAAAAAVELRTCATPVEDEDDANGATSGVALLEDCSKTRGSAILSPTPAASSKEPMTVMILCREVHFVSFFNNDLDGFLCGLGSSPS